MARRIFDEETGDVYELNFPPKPDCEMFAKELIHDPRLPMKELGMMIKLLTLPKDFYFTLENFTKTVPDGIDAVRNGMKRLEELGYVEISRQRDEHGKYNTFYTVYEVPQTKSKNE